uniref:small monomeric GTPase n=1 Tax=Syphacia muris TaxID=451379 RepID=A0A0N5AFU4_9BILA
FVIYLIKITCYIIAALAVKYIAHQFIGEYDPELEDTYCRQDAVVSQPLMVWVMDTVDGSGRDAMRYLSWADIYIVVYDVTSQLSLQYAESTLQQISTHEHHLCTRQHKCLLVGNKADLERYRQVSESDGEKLAKKFGAMFSEVSAVDECERVATLIRKPIAALIADRAKRRSPSPRLYSSDSEIASTASKTSFSASLKSVGRSGTLRRSSKSPKPVDITKMSTTKKTGSKLLKLFHN